MYVRLSNGDDGDDLEVRVGDRVFGLVVSQGFLSLWSDGELMASTKCGPDYTNAHTPLEAAILKWCQRNPGQVIPESEAPSEH